MKYYWARSKAWVFLSREMAINSIRQRPCLAGQRGENGISAKQILFPIMIDSNLKIPTGQAGDCYDRYWVKMLEMRQSLRIVRAGPCSKMPAAGEIQTRVTGLNPASYWRGLFTHEAPKGELGFYIVSDNSIAPYRYHIHGPSLYNLTALRT